MRIAFFSDFSLRQLSGVSDAVRMLMETLEEQGHAVRLYAPRYAAARDFDDTLREVTFPLPNIGIPWMPDYRICWGKHAMLENLRAFQPDVIHTHGFATTGVMAIRAMQILNVPLIGTSHGSPSDYLNFFWLDYRWARFFARRYESWFYNHCAAVTSPSQSMASTLRLRPGLVPHVISNPLNTGAFRPLPDKSPVRKALDLEGPTLLSFGRLSREKRVEETIEATAKVIARGTPCTLLVVGDGLERASLESHAAHLGILDRVRFLGALHGERLVETVNAADVMVITSRVETQSLTTLQSMACGLPVVGVRIGALPEVIRDGETGFIAEPGDTDTLASHIIRLLKDPALRKTMGEHGRTEAHSHAPQSVTAAFLSVYEEVMADKPVSSHPHPYAV